MPWLSRQNGEEEGVKSVDDSPGGHPNRSISSMINFVPAQIDEFYGTMPALYKQPALQIMLGDLRIIFQNLHCLPAMARATFSPKVLQTLFRSPVDARNTTLHLCTALVQIGMLIIALPAFLILPGIFFTTIIGAFWLFTLSTTWLLSGPAVLTNNCKRALMTDSAFDERWIYVNGMMCSHRSFQAQCNRLSSIFGRSVIGIHNRTSGLIFDLYIILLQRCLNISTPCTLTLASQIRHACLTNSVRKVVLISHSTGALHVSIALDQLHASLPVGALSKLEIYTFGSGAAHLSNPCLKPGNPYGLSVVGDTESLNYTRLNGNIASVKATPTPFSSHFGDHECAIPHVEHYALASDIFARCGVLHNTRNVLDNRFCGRVFVLDDGQISKTNGKSFPANGGGFLMIEHYLDLLFPNEGRDAGDILNQVVHVDIETAEKREFTAQGVALPQKSTKPARICPKHGGEDSPSVSPKTKFSSGGERAEKRTSWEMAAAMNVGGLGEAKVAARECEGRTVKQLSRLWRYLHGARPVGEGVAITNGVGKGHNGKSMSANGLGGMH